MLELDFAGSSGVSHRLNRRCLNRSVGLTGECFFSAAGSAHRLNRRFSNQCVGLTGGLYRAFSSAASCAVLRDCFRYRPSLFLGLFCVGLALP